MSPAAAVRGPMTPAAVLTLQRAVGNQAVARALAQEEHVHGADCGHGTVQPRAAVEAPEAPADILKAAMASGSRPIESGALKKAQSFYQNDRLSQGRVHTGSLAQRAVTAFGAKAMTVGRHIFFGAGVEHDTATAFHEYGHLDKNTRGITEIGTAGDSGVPVTNPDQHSEREAANDGLAAAKGAEVAPSVVARQAIRQDAVAARMPDGGLPVVQGAWERAEKPTTTSQGFGGTAGEAEVKCLEQAVDIIVATIDKAHKDEKKVLLYLGVGTGNPTGAWGNPSHGGHGSVTEDDQRNPGFLAHAQKQGSFVIAANFNNHGGSVTQHATENSLRIDVPARFPLTTADRKPVEAPMQKLEQVVKSVDRFALMNAVTDADYEHLVKLVESRTKRQPSAYLKSYMQTGATQAKNPKFNLTNKKPNNFSTLGDVFVQDVEE